MADLDYVEVAKRKHMVGIDEAVFLANRTIERQQAILTQELADKELIEKITNIEYEKLFPEKVKKVKSEFGIKKQQKQLADFEQMDIDNEKLSDADFVNKYPDKIQRQKDKYGEN